MLRTKSQPVRGRGRYVEGPTYRVVLIAGGGGSPFVDFFFFFFGGRNALRVILRLIVDLAMKVQNKCTRRSEFAVLFTAGSSRSMVLCPVIAGVVCF